MAVGTRSIAEIELDSARNILLGLKQDIEDLDRWWPPSKRGSNAQRVLKSIVEKRDAVELCVTDAAKSLGKET